MAKRLTHVDDAGRPAMVDVSGKEVTAREAVAECVVRFPAAVAGTLRADGMATKKGADTAGATCTGWSPTRRSSPARWR